jgi:hypothetical protein
MESRSARKLCSAIGPPIGMMARRRCIEPSTRTAKENS